MVTDAPPAAMEVTMAEAALNEWGDKDPAGRG